MRGEAETAQAQLDTARAQLSDKNAQVDADVRDALLDIALGAEAGRSGAVQRGAGQRSAQRGAGALRQRRQRQPGREPGAAVRGAGQRSICRQPLPAQRGQAQPGARAGRRRKTTRTIWEESKRGGFNTQHQPRTSRITETEIGAAAVPPQGHHHCWWSWFWC